MNAFIALFVATLAVAAQAGHVPTSWPLTTYGVDSWNGLNAWNGLNTWNGLNAWNGLNSWNTHAAYPYGANQWSSVGASAWPAYNAYNGWYGHGKATLVDKVNPWGLPAAHAGYGYGYNNYLGASVVPVASKYAPLVGHAINQKLIVA